MVTLHLADSKLEIKLEKTYKLASWNNPSPSTHIASTLHIATKPLDQLKTAAPSLAQPEPQ